MSFVQLDTRLTAACGNAVVLTPTERLRRNLVRAYADTMQSAGHRAWRTPEVHTLEGYLGALYQSARERQPSLPPVLSAEGEYELFRATAPGGLARLIPLAQEAWNLCHQWRIPIEASTLGASENGRLFLNWAQRVERRLDAEGAITRTQLPGHADVAAALESPAARLACVAFEHMPAAHVHWLERQSAQVEHISAPEGEPATPARESYESSAMELAAAAAWARDTLIREGESASIGIVIPDLSARYHAVARQFTAEFDPLLETGTDGLVDIGGGVPLADQPIWRAAFRWLTFCFDRVGAEAVRDLLDTPFLALPGLDRLPREAPPAFGLSTLVKLLPRPAFQRLLPATADEPRPLGDWLSTFLDCLEQAGWDGRNAGSVQFQAYEAADERLRRLSRSTDARPLPVGEALATLERYLGTVTFAPERSPAPVQVMGYLETTGLSFTHLRVLGMDDQSWPQSVNLNPFVPAATQRAAGVPRSSAALETAFAAERIRHWGHAATHLIFTHASNSGETRLRPSPLIRAYPERAALEPVLRGHPYLVHSHGELETVNDAAGTPSPAGAHSGGIGRIRDQALCPFRGYAIHRLALGEDRPPRALPDALDRGVLVHEALHHLYDGIRRDGRRADELSLTDFQAAAEAALDEHYGRFPEAFRSRERDRLINLLSTWNAFEISRGATAVEDLEETVEVAFDGIGLTLRIDRIDRLDPEGDALAVIDYKTGRVAARLNETRLVDPQLPIYALTNERIEAVLYAQVREDRTQLVGVSEHSIESARVDAPAGGDWEHQKASWRRQLGELTAEIRQGHAAVAPYDTRACQTCHLGRFCRVDADFERLDTESEEDA